MWLLVACAGSDPEPTDTSSDPPMGDPPAGCDAAPPAVDIGTGDKVFEPLEDGEPLTMVHGPQGGWHMLAGVRATSFRSVVTITYTIHRVADQAQISWNRYLVALAPAGECVGEYPGMYGYLDVHAIADGEADTPPEVLAGEALVLTLTVEDDDERSVTAQQWVVAALDPKDAG